MLTTTAALPIMPKKSASWTFPMPRDTMLNLVCGAMMMPLTKEQLLDLNAQLNTIAI